MNKPYKHVFLSGVGGSGMSAIALMLLADGYKVSGSDRSYDEGESPEKFAALKNAGVIMKPQDGSGIDADVDALIVSSAIEEKVPDVIAARKRQQENPAFAILKRADVLAESFNHKAGIAVGGTSGKSTVTAMLGHILDEAGMKPTVINGAAMVNALDKGAVGLGNAMIGEGEPFVIEADESDGTIALYQPDPNDSERGLRVAVLTNITLDHKPVEQTLPLFRSFVERATKGAVVNLDNQGSASLREANAKTFTFSLKDASASYLAENIEIGADGTRFSVREKDTGDRVTLKIDVPGKHNVENALAAIAAARMSGVSLKDAAHALESYRGVKRRLEVLGRAGGVTVIDDFGHNPDKVAASVAALRQAPGRLIIFFQPHGFEPMRLMGDGIMQAFAEGLNKDDVVILSDILYKGGTVNRSISSADLVAKMPEGGPLALHIANRPDIADYILANVRAGDRIVVMGARDDSLTDFALGLLQAIKTVPATSKPDTPRIAS